MASFLPVYIIFCGIRLAHTQYIVDTKLDPYSSDLFCSSHCESELGSIHSEEQFQSIQSLSKYDSGNGIWIGLKANPHPLYEWNDGSRLDFAKWASSEPSAVGIECVSMSSTSFEWITSSCNTAKRSLCNHCNHHINKYILLYLDVINIGYSYSLAQTACSMYSISSTLASIHSERDFKEASTLCWLLGNDCWIGLNDLNLEGIYTYDDGTTFDYGFNSMRIHHADKDCIHLSSINNYTLTDSVCSSSKYALCHIPSLLCSVNALWTKINGNMDGDCTKILSEESDIVMPNKLWYNGPDALVIDYIFFFKVNDDTKDANSGIVIYNSIQSTTCKYYYIFVEKIANTNIYNLGLLYQYGSTTYILNIVNIDKVYNDIDSHLLSIHLTPNDNIFTIYIDDIKLINYQDTTHKDDVKHDGFSGYIGLKTSSFATTTAKSLYISGTGYTLTTSIDIVTTSICPTIAPTTSPTINPSTTATPSTIPTKYPTPCPSTNPTLNPTNIPTVLPSNHPTLHPSNNPTLNPTNKPTLNPSIHPTNKPTFKPSIDPTNTPTNKPLNTYNPSVDSTVEPTNNPSLIPTNNPSIIATNNPTHLASINPTLFPSTSPSVTPIRVQFGGIVTAELQFTVGYDGINIVFILDDVLSDHDIGDITYSLEELTNELILTDCGYSSGFESIRITKYPSAQQSIINGSMITCDISGESALISSITDSSLPRRVIQSIKQETKIQIIITSTPSIKYKTKSTTTTTLSLFESTQSIQSQYSWMEWMLKLIVIQMGLCCLLLACFFGIKIRTKMIKKDKLAIEQQIESKKIKYSPKMEGIVMNNDDIMTRSSPYKIEQQIATSHGIKFNNSGGISTFAMPNNYKLEQTIPLSDDSGLADDCETMDHESNKSNIGYNRYIKQLMVKMRNNNKKIKKESKNCVNTASEIEMSTYEDTDGPFSFKSTFPAETDHLNCEQKTVLIHRIDTDTTFPSIPLRDMFSNSYNNTDNTSNVDAVSCGDTIQQPVPESVTSDQDTISHIELPHNYHHHHNKMSTTSSTSSHNGIRRTSYLTICDKCGTNHRLHLGGMAQEAECAHFAKFNNKTLY